MFKLAEKTKSYLEVVIWLTVMMPLLPLVERARFEFWDYILSVSFLFLIVVCLHTLATRGIAPKQKWVKILVYVTAVSAVGLDSAFLVFDSLSWEMEWLKMAAAACYAVLILVCCIVITRDLFTGKTVSADKIYGSVAVYLLLGMLWTCLYSALQILNSGALAYGDGTVPQTFIELIYFSFTNMATVGFGDITVRTPAGMSLAVMQMVVGTFYVAVVVARLVGIFTARAMLDRDAEDGDKQ